MKDSQNLGLFSRGVVWSDDGITLEEQQSHKKPSLCEQISRTVWGYFFKSAKASSPVKITNEIENNDISPGDQSSNLKNG